MGTFSDGIGNVIGRRLLLLFNRKQYAKKFNSITAMEDYLIDSLNEGHHYVTHVVNPDNTVFLIMDYRK